MENILKEIVNGERENFKAFHRECNIIADKVFKAISQKVKAARWLIAGSIGKRTSVGIHHDSLPDFDLVIFLNQDPSIANEKSPFGKTVDIVSEIVGKISPDFQFIRAHRCTIQCMYNSSLGQVKFDIVLGYNVLPNPKPESDHGMIQLEKVLKLLSDDPNSEGGYLSSSLAEAAVQFVEEQPPFVHDIILLAKLWNKMRIPADSVGYISGRSSIIELMAIQAANLEMKKNNVGKATYLGAFKTFLTMFVQKRKYLRVIFPLKINPNHLAYTKYLQMTQEDGGIVLDPVNPYNNLLDGLKGPAWSIFNGQARRCLDLITLSSETKLAECFKPPASPMKTRPKSKGPNLRSNYLLGHLGYPSYK